MQPVAELWRQFRAACEHLVWARVIRPGVIKMLERVATAREAANGETFDRVVHLLTAQRQVELDELLVVDDTVGSIRLAWLNKGPTEASASAVKAEVSKLLYLRGLDRTRWTCRYCRPNAVGSWRPSAVG